MRFECIGKKSCPRVSDAALMLLGSLPHQKNIVHLNCLHNIISEFNCRYIHEELSCFTAQAANFNYVTINDSQSGYGNLISQFQNTFPIWPNFLLKTSSCLENWSFMETTLVWQDEYLECLISAFATSGITLSRPASHNLICLLSGIDREWANYSTNQAIKYCPVDTSEFTRETVSKPIFDSNHHEDFIVGVWQHYFYYFANMEYPKSLLRKVLGDFVLAWNRSWAINSRLRL
jgi:hypothetical protein